MRNAEYGFINVLPHIPGEECVLAGNKRVIRKTEARVVCSPDAKVWILEGADQAALSTMIHTSSILVQVHMLVREPNFCQYVYVIYSPALCQVDGFKPIPRTVPLKTEEDDDEYI